MPVLVTSKIVGVLTVWPLAAWLSTLSPPGGVHFWLTNDRGQLPPYTPAPPRPTRPPFDRQACPPAGDLTPDADRARGVRGLRRAARRLTNSPSPPLVSGPRRQLAEGEGRRNGGGRDASSICGMDETVAELARIMTDKLNTLPKAIIASTNTPACVACFLRNVPVQTQIASPVFTSETNAIIHTGLQFAQWRNTYFSSRALLLLYRSPIPTLSVGMLVFFGNCTKSFSLSVMIVMVNEKLS